MADMALKDALEIVLDLASGNTLDEQIVISDMDEEGVEALIKEQHEAIEIVGNHLEELKAEAP